MESFDDQNLTSQPPPRFPVQKVGVIALIIVQVILALWSTPFLPDQLPVHWNISGDIDGWAPGKVVIWSSPLLSLLFTLIFWVLIGRGPQLNREGVAANRRYGDFFLLFLVCLGLILQLIWISLAWNLDINVRVILGLTISLMLVMMGNYMGKLRRNFWLGIRTPWTLISDRSWERTHRLGGWLLFTMGIIGLPLALFPLLWFPIMGILLIGIVLLLVFYSYRTASRA
jgi:uncharacterized membrane protein